VHGSLGHALRTATQDLLTVDPDEIAAIATRWENAGDTVGGLTFGPIRQIFGTSSRVITALRSTGESAESAADKLAAQLRSTASTCRKAAATLTDTDDAASEHLGGGH